MQKDFCRKDITIQPDFWGMELGFLSDDVLAAGNLWENPGDEYAGGKSGYRYHGHWENGRVYEGIYPAEHKEEYEYVHQIDAVAQGRDFLYRGVKPFGYAVNVAKYDEHAEGHEGYVECAETPAEFSYVVVGGGKRVVEESVGRH